MREKKIHEEVLDSFNDVAEGRRQNAVKTKDFLKKNAKKSAAVGVLMLSLLTGLIFSGPADITQDQVGTNLNKTPVVMDIDDYMSTSVDDDDDDATEQKKGSMGMVAMFRQAILSLPQFVRILVILPLWLLGTGIMTLLSVFWKFLFASPIGGVILSTIVGWGILVGLFALTAKLLFPDIPLKQILTKKNLIVLGVVALGLAGADAIAPLFWNKYPFAAGAVKLGVGALIVGVLTARVKAVFGRDKYKNMPAAA